MGLAKIPIFLLDCFLDRQDIDDWWIPSYCSSTSKFDFCHLVGSLSRCWSWTMYCLSPFLGVIPALILLMVSLVCLAIMSIWLLSISVAFAIFLGYWLFSIENENCDASLFNIEPYLLWSLLWISRYAINFLNAPSLITCCYRALVLSWYLQVFSVNLSRMSVPTWDFVMPHDCLNLFP